MYAVTTHNGLRDNTSGARGELVTAFTQYLSNLKGSSTIDGYTVTCDGSNNSPMMPHPYVDVLIMLGPTLQWRITIEG